MKILIILLFMLLASIFVPCTNAADFLINCGLPESENDTNLDGSRWESDDGAAFSPPDIKSISSAATASGGSTNGALFTHARIFKSSCKYSFVVSQGPKFIRLYFTKSSTIIYKQISASQSFVSLTANEFTLLTNFSAYLNSEFLNSYKDGSFIEFYVPVLGTILNLTFSSPKHSSGFVNAIEIVSVPDGLYLNNSGSQVIYPNYANEPNAGGYTMQGMTSFQTMYRLIAGHADVPATDDVGRLGRTWYNDDKYIYGDFYGDSTYFNDVIDGTKYNFTKISHDSAPVVVYESQRYMWKDPLYALSDKKNLTWQFWVDPGFYYLLRLHLCENNKGVNGSSIRQFKVLINNFMADNVIDVFELSGGFQHPYYVDFIFEMYALAAAGSGDGFSHLNSTTGKAQLLFTLVPYTNTKTKDVLLNGLEILKLNRSDGSLTAPNPSLPPTTPTAGNNSSTNDGKHRTLVIIGGAVGGAILIILVLAFIFICRQKANAMIPLPSDDTDKSKKNSWVPITSFVSGSAGTNTTTGSSLPSDLCRRFSLAQIRIATSDFDESFIVGVGGFGKVYRGTIDGGTTTVAIKRLTSTSKQGVNEFRTEIEMLSRLRHLHLVTLIGYCEDQGEMILVYDYMPRGTLRDHLLYKNSDVSSIEKPLSWKQRLMICVGSARGLHYLHSGTKDLIIHRDVKSTNILLDEKWTAKVSDFGLSKVGPTSESGIGHVSTAVKGSFGYLDPEYIKRHRLTEKSDVYSFGVVLFEVLCGRPAVKPNVPKEQVNLAKWARSCYLSGTLHTIIDPNLAGQTAPESLTKFGEIAEMCVRDEANQRPMMGDVVWALEFALQLQETAEKNNTNDGPLEEYAINDADDGTTDNDMFSGTVDSGASEAMSMDKSNTNTSVSSHHMGIKSGSIFSEIMDPQAR